MHETADPVEPASPNTPAPAVRARSGVPVMTGALIAANLLMAAAQVAATGFRWRSDSIGNDQVDWALGAKVPSLVAHGEYWRLVTASFLHGDWFHLGFNILALLFLGRVIEAFYGRARLLPLFILSAVSGTVASYLFTHSVSLGASTGIMGLMGALLTHNLRYRRFLPERLNTLYPILVSILMVQLVVDFFSQRVDAAGHVGGLLGGIAMGLLLESRISGPLQSERDWLPLPTALATTFALLLYGAGGLLSSLPHNVSLLRAGRTEDPAAQARHLERAVTGRPYFIEAQLTLADLLIRSKRHDEALNRHRELLRANPGDDRILARFEALAGEYLRRAQREANRGEWELAGEHFRRAAEYTSDRDVRAMAYLGRAQAAYELRQWEQALINYRRSSEEATDRGVLSSAHNGYAWVLADKLIRRLDEAERHALLAVKNAPRSPAILDTLAWVYYRQGRYPEALKRQQFAVRLAEQQLFAQPDAAAQTAELQYHLGAIFEKLERREEARGAYERALRSRPGYPEAAAALARISPPRPPGDDPVLSTPGEDPARARGIL